MLFNTVKSEYVSYFVSMLINWIFLVKWGNLIRRQKENTCIIKTNCEEMDELTVQTAILDYYKQERIHNMI